MHGDEIVHAHRLDFDVVVVVISNPDMLAGQRALGNRGDMDNELVNTKHRIGLGQNGYSDSSPREARLEPKWDEKENCFCGICVLGFLGKDIGNQH